MRREAFFRLIIVAVLVAGCGAQERRADETRHTPPPATPAQFIIKPYLVHPTTTGMTIAWTAPTDGEFVVCFGKDQSLDRQLTVRPTTQPAEYVRRATSQPADNWPVTTQPSAVIEYQYLARLTGLLPSGSYRYEVLPTGQGGQPGGRPRSQPIGGTFRTMAPPGEPFTFIACSDSQDGQDFRKVASHFARYKPRLILHSGDVVNTGSYLPNMNTEFFRPLGQLAGTTPVLPAQGNHDSRWLRWLFRPGGKSYYSYDCGDVHFVCLDSFLGPSNIDKMLAWLEEDLAGSRARWKIAYHHFGSYDVGAHMMHWGRETVLPLYRKYGVDVVFSGHSHAYQRFRPMFTPGQNDKSPITHIITGTSGYYMHRAADDHYLASSASMVHNFIVIDASAERLSFRCIDEDGAELDSFHIDKDKAGNISPQYMATAIAEAEFGELRALVWPSVKAPLASDDLMSGRPVRVPLEMSAGEKPMKFTLKLEPRAAAAFEMAPVSGQTRPCEIVPIELAIRLREPEKYATPEDSDDDDEAPKVSLPVLRLECFYEIDGHKGSVFSGRVIYRPPATQPE